MAGSASDGFGNFVGLIPEKGQNVRWVRLHLEHPFRTFFTNTPRGGSKHGQTIDLFGIADDPLKLRYAAVRLRQ